MRYAIVIETAEENYSAYVPDLPGCVATGPTIEAVEQDIRDAIRFHIAGLREDGVPVPAATSIAEYVEAGAPAPRLLGDGQTSRSGCRLAEPRPLPMNARRI
jgi:predicted RNase H-like HicB family nuclease